MKDEQSQILFHRSSFRVPLSSYDGPALAARVRRERLVDFGGRHLAARRPPFWQRTLPEPELSYSLLGEGRSSFRFGPSHLFAKPDVCEWRCGEPESRRHSTLLAS